MKKTIVVLTGLLVLVMALPAVAHFQMIYTPESALEKAATIDLKLVFTHPFEAGHTMDMSQPEQFFVARKEKKKDLLGTLKPITWTSLTNSGAGYETAYKLRGMGDNVFCLVPGPYYEKEENIYIQQVTKMVVNTAGFPTDWDAEIGLPAEIIALDKPYGLWTGNVFRGIVKSNGKPVPFAEIEVEFLNHQPLMDKNAFAEKALVQAPPGCLRHHGHPGRCPRTICLRYPQGRVVGLLCPGRGTGQNPQRQGIVPGCGDLGPGQGYEITPEPSAAIGDCMADRRRAPYPPGSSPGARQSDKR